MEESGTGDKGKERVMNFALLIRQTVGQKGINYFIRSENQGILDSEIILMVESWLEKVKDSYKSRIKDSISFGSGDKK